MLKSVPRHLLEEVKEHKLDYLVLVFGLLIGLGFFVYFSGQQAVQTAAVFLLALFYFFWGIIHHAFKKDLHFKVILEYLLISLLGLVVFLSLVKRL